MKVISQYFHAYLDKGGSMFDFNIRFFIVDPDNPYIQASYEFDKTSTPKQDAEVKQIDKMNRRDSDNRTQFFLGADDPAANDKKPFRFNTLTEQKILTNVDAQVDLESFNSEHFTVTVSLLKKKNHAVNLTFKGQRPSWLDIDGKAIFNGKLMLIKVKNFLDDMKPRF
jgi:hypothetical protein